MKTVRPRAESDAGIDLVVVAALVAATFALQAWRLSGAAMPAADEGVYALTGRLMMSGYAPHVDFPLWHMPLLPFLMGLGLKFTNSLLPLRLLYLALNCLAVFPLWAVLKRLTGHRLAAVTGIAFYLTFGEMMHHDFRFIAMRQSATFLLILFLWCGVFDDGRAWRRWVQYVCCVASAMLFLPASLNIAIAALALTAMAPRKQRARLIREYTLMLACAGACVGLYFLVTENALQQVVLEHLHRPAMSRWWRVLRIAQSPDTFIAGFGFAGLLLGLLLPKLRAICAAMLAAAFFSVFLSPNYFHHYISLAGPALAMGVAAGVLCIDRGVRQIVSKRLHATAVLAICLVLIAFQAATVLPSLLQNWLIPAAPPSYWDTVETLSRQPEPILISPALLALDSGQMPVLEFHELLFRPPVPQGISAGKLALVEGRACTIFVDETMLTAVPETTMQGWMASYETVFVNILGVILRTNHPGCALPRAVQ